MQTSTMMKAEISITSHPVNDASTQPLLFIQLTVIFIGTCSFLPRSCNGTRDFQHYP